MIYQGHQRGPQELFIFSFCLYKEGVQHDQIYIIVMEKKSQLYNEILCFCYFHIEILTNKNIYMFHLVDPLMAPES